MAAARAPTSSTLHHLVWQHLVRQQCPALHPVTAWQRHPGPPPTPAMRCAVRVPTAAPICGKVSHASRQSKRGGVEMCEVNNLMAMVQDSGTDHSSPSGSHGDSQQRDASLQGAGARVELEPWAVENTDICGDVMTANLPSITLVHCFTMLLT